MKIASSNPLVLALFPNVSGLAYAAFEGELRPVDWGIKTARKKKHVTLMRHASGLIDLFSPDTIILPVRRAVEIGSRRLQRVSNEIEQLAITAGRAVHWYSRLDIKQCFAPMGVQNKDAIAAAIARLLPEFEQHLPPARRIWMSEHHSMGLFDAVALAMTYYKGTQGGELACKIDPGTSKFDAH